MTDMDIDDISDHYSEKSFLDKISAKTIDHKDARESIDQIIANACQENSKMI